MYIDGKPLSAEELDHLHQQCRAMGMLNEEQKIKQTYVEETYIAAFLCEIMEQRMIRRYPHIDVAQLQSAIGQAAALASIDCNPISDIWLAWDALSPLCPDRSNLMAEASLEVPLPYRENIHFSLDKGKLQCELSKTNGYKFVSIDDPETMHIIPYISKLHGTFEKGQSQWEGAISRLEYVPEE